MKVVIVGGGPAGMLAAISASNEKNEVILIEKNAELGRKILITGKGRCNITSSLDIDDFIKNIPGNGKFLFSAFQNYTNKDIINLLESNSVKTKIERGNRVFPVSDNAKDVRDALKKVLNLRSNITIRYNSKVSELIVSDSICHGVILENGEKISADKVILATGGKSYPATGSTGDGYKLAIACGHTIENIRGSLVPLIADKVLCQSMQGVSLRNVGIKFKDIESNKVIYDDFGEMLFTHFGVSGPTILSASAHLLRYKNINSLLSQGKIKLLIDLKPALDEEKLDKRLLRDFENFKNKEFKNSLNELLPQKMIEPIINLSNINPKKEVNSITREERLGLIKILKGLEITINGFRPVEEAIVTAGGINIKEINPKTMESKLINGLYFAGEIIDVDAYTGGFNLQIAYSTGYTAGLNL